MGRKYGSAVDVPKVASTPTSPSAGYVSLYAKSDDKVYSLSSGGTETDLTATGGGGGTTELLATTAYNPATVTNVTNATTTFTVVDATNLTVTFTVPASGAVILSLCAGAKTSASAPAMWGVGVGGTVVAASTASVTLSTATARPTHRVKITGLTPGASITYQWMHANASTQTTTTSYGGTGTSAVGQALMEVWSA